MTASEPKKIELSVASGAASASSPGTSAPRKIELSPCVSSPRPSEGLTPARSDMKAELPQLPKYPLLLSEALPLPSSSSPRGAAARSPQSPEPTSRDEDLLDARTPKKIQLPAGAVGFDCGREPSADEEPIALGRMPNPPAQADSLAVPLLLSDSLPPSPPTLAPGRLHQQLQQQQQSPSMLMDSLLPMPPMPGSPTPALPGLFGQAAEAMASWPGVGLDMACAAADVQAELMQQADMLQWWGADFTPYGTDGEFTPYSIGDFSSFQFGLQPPLALPSRGSILHGTGTCRPCAWFWKASGCQNKENCGHCHLCPEGETKARKKAKQTGGRTGPAAPTSAGLKMKEVVNQAMLSPGLELTASPISVRPESEQGSTSISGAASNSEEEAPATGLAAEGLDLTGSPNEGMTSPAIEAEVDTPGLVASLHGIGKCRPCAWFWKPAGCQNDKECAYCHLCPETELKQRKKLKQTMIRSGFTPKARQQEGRFPLDLASATLAEAPESSKFALNLASLI